MRPLPAAVAAALLLASRTLPSQAQTSAAPIPVAGPAFARTSTRLYIQGGDANNSDATGAANDYGQFFYLDLTVAWNATSPAWTRLNDGIQQDIFPAVFSADQQSMMAFHLPGTAFAYRYSVASGQWSASSLIVGYGDYQGVGAVTDPTTGLVYMAGGYTDPTRNTMDIYNFTSDSIASLALPSASQMFPNRAYYTNVWSQKRSSILYFGGYNSTLQPIANGNTITEFVPSTLQWSTLTSTGTGPSMRADHCMASNDDGSIVIIYGGRLPDGTFSGEIFMFDTVNQVWTQGAAGPVRFYTACTIAGTQFVAWGGRDVNRIIAPSAALIYDITAGKWVTQYVPSLAYVDSPATSPPSNHAGAIAGGAVAGTVVICIGVLFFVLRRRQHRPTPVKTTGDHDDAGPRPRSDEELHRMRAQLQSQQDLLELQGKLLLMQQQQHQQQQQLLLPVHQYPYQDAPHHYIPPTIYSPSGLSNPASPSGMDTRPSPNSFKVMAASSGPSQSGYVNGNSQYVVRHMAAPVVHVPMPTTSTAKAATTAKIQKPAKQDITNDGNPWSRNPHAVIDT